MPPRALLRRPAGDDIRRGAATAIDAESISPRPNEVVLEPFIRLPGRGILQHMDIADCLPLVYHALGRVNALRLPEDQIPEVKEVVLVGDEGLLDSLALASLILALENQLLAKTGKDISLMAEADFDRLTEQFRTPQAIAEHIAGKL
jgi:acyl carrier protein